MSSFHPSNNNSSIVPVSAEEISRRSYEQRYLIEDKIVISLIEIINQGVREQVAHGLLEYEFSVPSFIYGFPKFDSDYVCTKLRELYASKGFTLLHEGSKTTLIWKQRTTPTTATSMRPSSSSSTTTKTITSSSSSLSSSNKKNIPSPCLP